MKTFNTNTLIDQLQGDIRNMLLTVGQLAQEPATVLETPPPTGGWSIAQVTEHLNIYCRYYITAIEQALHLNNTRPDTLFKPGWLGDYFTGLMQPVAGQTIKKKMKAPKNGIPSAQPDARQMLEEFSSHQHHLLQLLQIARSANLSRIRIPTSISKWIRLKLGDTFRFLVAHEERHFVQISHVLRQTKTVAAIT